MNAPITHADQQSHRSWNREVGILLLGAAAFHAAYAFPRLAFLLVVYLGALVMLANTSSFRRAFRLGIAIGLLVFGPQLGFFWNIFGGAAIALWLVLAFWTGLFMALAHGCLLRCGRIAPLLLACLWTGLEFFRSELYYLRFSWINAGYGFSETPVQPFVGAVGVYGTSFVLMLAAAALLWVPERIRVSVAAAGLAVFGLVTNLLPSPKPEATAGKILRVAGVQLEFPAVPDALAALDRLIAAHPDAELLSLCEYSFDGPVPLGVRRWCKERGRWLVVGAKDELPGREFYDTAFVIDPNGETVFKQAKCVPIQFFNDGLPAREQKLWNSPWGNLGICICYDLSYSRVTDELIRQGAQALIVPTMDLIDWGNNQHHLHGRVAPIRAAEYRVPIFRVASSGVSQIVDKRGAVLASAGCPGQGEMVAASIELPPRGRLPWDRTLAPLCVAVTVATAVWLAVAGFVTAWRRRKLAARDPAPQAVENAS